MDRNDDFVSIDELFQSLNAAEEKEPVGAWDKMEGILNEKMPLNADNSSRKYGFLIPIAALILVIGGAMFVWNKNEIKNNLNTHTTHENNKIAHNENTTLNNKRTESITEKSIMDLHALDSNMHSDNKNKASKQQILASSGKSIPTTNKSRFESNKSQIPELKQTKMDGLKSLQEKRTQHSISNNKKFVNPIIADSLFVKHPIIEQKIVEIVKGDQEEIKKSLAIQNDSKSEKWTPEFSYNDKKIVGNQHGQLFEKEKENFERVDITQKQIIQNQTPTRIKLIIDTVSIAKIQQIKYTPLSRLETYNIKQLLFASIAPIMETVNAAELASNSVTNTSFLVPLSNYKVKSKRINTIDFIKNTAGGINNYFDGSHKFFAGFLFGGNASISNQNAYGMQIGVVGNYVFAERWTLSAEFKFINKYFPDLTYQDDENSYQVNKTQQNNGWLYTGSGTTISSKYIFKNINSLNLPLYLGYNVTDRLSVIAGVNFNYYLPLNYSKSNTLNNFEVNELRASSESPYLNSGFKLNETQDFKTRFGIGYLAGLNYEFSRRFSLDCRVTQTVWSKGIKNIPTLENIYMNPSLELSLGFYFGRREKVIYIMERR